jgi:hypothetical protein
MLHSLISEIMKIILGVGTSATNYVRKSMKVNEGVLGEWMYSSTHSLTSTLDEGEWSASRTGRFTSRERAPGAHWIGGWVGPRAVLSYFMRSLLHTLFL